MSLDRRRAAGRGDRRVEAGGERACQWRLRDAMQAWVYIKPGEVRCQRATGRRPSRRPRRAWPSSIRGRAGNWPPWRDNLFPAGRSGNQEGPFRGRRLRAVAGTDAAPTTRSFTRWSAISRRNGQKRRPSEGYSQGLAALAALDRHFPGNAALNDAAKSYVWRHVVELADAGGSMMASRRSTRPEGLCRARARKSELGAFVFDKGAKARIEANAGRTRPMSTPAALKQFPESDLLRNNVAYMAQEWQKAAYARAARPRSPPSRGSSPQIPGIRRALPKAARNQIAARWANVRGRANSARRWRC